MASRVVCWPVERKAFNPKPPEIILIPVERFAFNPNQENMPTSRYAAFGSFPLTG
jgi:hypothetical protein